VRIAIVNWSRRRVGGAEAYLSSVIPQLHRAGHTIAFWHECDEPVDRERILLPDGSPSWCVAELGIERALAELRSWGPDLIYAHGLLDAATEAEVIKVAPSVFFAHNYYGTCISGAKAFKKPATVPCHRRFGWQCLLQFYPRRCGGLSPITMWKQYRLQAERLDLLSKYGAIIVFSEHMRNEYARHGLAPYLAYDFSRQLRSGCEHSFGVFSIREISEKPYWQILFLGRMELIKGGRILLDALPRVSVLLGHPLRVVFVGDGPDRAVWQRKAEQVQGLCKDLTIEFTGWMSEREVDSLLSGCDLLVLPSLWPEPFGLAVMEAGRHGVPVVAFAVGGIPYWLTDGVNGHLAPADPPTAAGLAEAIHKCLSDPAKHFQLRCGAIRRAEQFCIENHLIRLEEIFEEVVRQGIRS
jgi:glycosyltransferase involved in cell wall biosynthesis